jgi:hypothetical protein
VSCKFQLSVIFAFIINLLLITTIVAQNLDYKTVDSISLDSYYRKDWPALETIGKQSLRAGVDYYYLRLRLGIAAYEQRKFTVAERHFRKAMEFNNYDPTAQSYLTGTLLETFRLTEAGSVFNRSLPTAKEFVPIKKGFRVNSVHTDIGMINRNENDNLGFKKLAGDSSIFGQQRIYDDSQIYDAGTFLQLRPNLLLYAGFQWIDTKATDRFAYIENNLKQDSTVSFDWGSAYYYSVDSVQKTKNTDHQILQRSAYLQTRWSPSSRLTFTAAAHLVRLYQTQTIAVNDSFPVTDTAFYITYNDSVGLFTTYLNRTDFQEDTILTYDWSASLHARYSFGRVATTLGANIAQLNGDIIRQFSVGLVYLPFGNSSLYSQTELIAVKDKSETNYILKEMIGGRITDRVWLDVGMMIGKINRFSDQFSYIIFNNPEMIRLRIEPTLYCVISKHLQLQLRYKYQQSESYYYTYTSPDLIFTENTINNQAYAIIGGIKWIF